MTNGHYFVLLSRYNQWMNENFYKAAQKLSHEQLTQDRGAFFGSILNTLNHIMVADILWLKRFAKHPTQFPDLQPVLDMPQPAALNEMLHSDLESWWQARLELDTRIMRWCESLTAEDLIQPLSYGNRKGEPFLKEFGALIVHMFNHQTHHRGQASTLFNQLGVDVGVTDLAVLIPEAEETLP